jgi:pimeloyl-ACP methyl ester carboxylesterase
LPAPGGRLRLPRLGRSDKPAGYAYTASNQIVDLNAVIVHLQLSPVVLVAHDASDPPAIDWALDHPERVSALVLLNTHCRTPGRLRPPEAIWLFSTPSSVGSPARPRGCSAGCFATCTSGRWGVSSVAQENATG